MDLSEFKAKYPDIYRAVFDEGKKAGYDEGLAKGEALGLEKGRSENTDKAKAEGARVERERIKAIEAQAIPGHEKLIEQMKFDGVTTGEQAAVKILQAEKTLRITIAGQLKTDAPKPVTHAAPPEPGAEQPEDKTLPIAERAKANWDKDPALRTEFAGDYERYLAFATAVENGRVKVIAKKSADR
jgi:hypothetical protein